MIKQICTKCVMDTATPRTTLDFDEFGVCNNCRNYNAFVKEFKFDDFVLRQQKLDKKLQEIKEFGKGKRYDCVLGLSGGLDSSYLAVLAKKYGLRPLVVHFDNGWDSELAIKNINNIVKKLNADLFTYVIDWEEFKDLQRAYINASVIDIEVPTDHFIYATLCEIAYKYNIPYILDGNNVASEFWRTTQKWSYSKSDMVNMLSIHKKFGTRELKKFPKLGVFERYFYNWIFGMQSVYLANYLPFNRTEIVESLQKEFDWREPEWKHYESIFTRFYQGYILVKKFGIDKRKVHLSNLIWSGQMTREEALQKLSEPPYSIEQQEQDKEYFLKKLGYTAEEFERIMQEPLVEHDSFPTENVFNKYYNRFARFQHYQVAILRKLGLKKLFMPFLYWQAKTCSKWIRKKIK